MVVCGDAVVEGFERSADPGTESGTFSWTCAFRVDCNDGTVGSRNRAVR